MIFWKPTLVPVSIGWGGRWSRGHPNFTEGKSVRHVIELFKMQELMYVNCPTKSLFCPFGAM